MSNVGNSASVAYKIARLRILQVVIQDTVQAACLVLVSIDAVFNVLWCVAREMVSLALHGSYTSIKEKQLYLNGVSGLSLLLEAHRGHHTQLLTS
jgi:hypothetical protein